MYKLSLIVPIYNVEKYIKDCLLSILEQLTPEIQIICINDGTPDKSMDIAKSLISEYDSDIQRQFLLINQENKGLGGARNTGINVAEGEYIGFIDTDDKILPNYVNTLLEIINKDSYDIIDFNIITSNGDVIHTRKGDFASLDSVFRSSTWYSHARLCKRDLISNHIFFPNLYYEDLALTPFLYLDAKKTIHIEKSLYWYRLNEEGITLSSSDDNNSKTINSLNTIVENYINSYEESKNPYLAVISIQTYFLLCINACKRLGLKKSLSYVQTYEDAFERLNEKASLNEKYYNILDSRVRLFYKHPKLYLSLYSIYCKIR